MAAMAWAPPTAWTSVTPASPAPARHVQPDPSQRTPLSPDAHTPHHVDRLLVEALRAVNRLDVGGRDLESAPQSGIESVQRRADGLVGDTGLLEAHAVEALGQVEECRIAPLPNVEQQRLRLYAHLLGHGCARDERSICGRARCGQRVDRDHGMSFSIGITRIEVAPAAFSGPSSAQTASASTTAWTAIIAGSASGITVGDCRPGITSLMRRRASAGAFIITYFLRRAAITLASIVSS